MSTYFVELNSYIARNKIISIFYLTDEQLRIFFIEINETYTSVMIAIRNTIELIIKSLTLKNTERSIMFSIFANVNEFVMNDTSLLRIKNKNS